MSHLDRRIRLEAQWELAGRRNTTEFSRGLADVSLGTIARLHCVWGLGQTARLHPELRDAVAPSLASALADGDLDVRAAAASVVGDLRLEQFSAAIVQAIGDPEPRVRYAACLAAGKLRLAEAIDPVSQMLQANADQDPGLRHAGIMALKGIGDVEALVALKDHDSRSVRLASVVALRKLQSPQVADFLLDTDADVQLEAARAIHDVAELHAALPALAGLAGTPLASDALAHRVLNANFRLGGEAAAQAIAAFAANRSHSEAMRQEAIEMLGTWGQPGQLDRVMNRFMPLEPRDKAPAAAAFESQLAGILVGSDELLNTSIETAIQLELAGTSNVLREIAIDSTRDATLRGNALKGYCKFEKAEAKNLVAELVSDRDPRLRSQALRLLAGMDQQAALPAIQRVIDSTHSVERQAAWDTLAEIELPAATELIEQGLQRYIAGKLEPDVWLNVIEAAEGRVPPEAIEALNQFEQQLSQRDSLEAYRDCTFGGDPQAGKELFFNKTELSCVRCHKIQGVGGEVGPNLSEIAKTKDNRYLLQSIVEPDAKIAENFETAVLLTEDDQIVTGILRHEDASRIELIDAEGKIIELDPEEIVSRKKGKSAMPIDLLKHLTRRELRDLVAYLASLTGA